MPLYPIFTENGYWDAPELVSQSGTGAVIRISGYRRSYQNPNSSGGTSYESNWGGYFYIQSSGFGSCGCGGGITFSTDAVGANNNSFHLAPDPDPITYGETTYPPQENPHNYPESVEYHLSNLVVGQEYGIYYATSGYYNPSKTLFFTVPDPMATPPAPDVRIFDELTGCNPWVVWLDPVPQPEGHYASATDGTGACSYKLQISRVEAEGDEAAADYSWGDYAPSYWDYGQVLPEDAQKIPSMQRRVKGISSYGVNSHLPIISGKSYLARWVYLDGTGVTHESVYNSDTGQYQPPVPPANTLAGPTTPFVAPFVTGEVAFSDLHFNTAAGTWTGTCVLEPTHGFSPYEVYWPTEVNGTRYATKV